MDQPSLSILFGKPSRGALPLERLHVGGRGWVREETATLRETGTKPPDGDRVVTERDVSAAL